MTKGHRGKLSPILSPDRARRFCIPCVVHLRCYALGVELQFEGATGEDGIVSYGYHDFKMVVKLVGSKDKTCAAR